MKVSGCVPAAVVVLSGAVASFSITAIASFVLLYCQSRGLSSQWGGIFYCSKIKYRKYKVHYFCIICEQSLQKSKFIMVTPQELLRVSVS